MKRCIYKEIYTSKDTKEYTRGNIHPKKHIYRGTYIWKRYGGMYHGIIYIKEHTQRNIHTETIYREGLCILLYVFL